jgi:hypothetical protein
MHRYTPRAEDWRANITRDKHPRFQSGATMEPMSATSRTRRPSVMCLPRPVLKTTAGSSMITPNARSTAGSILL